MSLLSCRITNTASKHPHILFYSFRYPCHLQHLSLIFLEAAAVLLEALTKLETVRSGTAEPILEFGRDMERI